MCKLLIPWGLTQSYQSAADLLSLATGNEFDEDTLVIVAKRVRLLERAFNAIRGVRRKNEKPPRKLFEKAVSDGKFKGEVLHAEQFEEMLSDYYKQLGYDTEGVPLREVFENLGLLGEWELFNTQMH
ncbi:MAG: hypothetical protein HOD92_08015 [Deltaproteobacteria bacterium]|nr:hypothetical protein [Deltaproteobacteria bacterium]